MFGTLRLNAVNNTNEFIEHAKGEEASYLGGYVFCHSACTNCRSKKLRCSGQKSGCDRCKAGALTCTYSESVEGRRSRQKSQTEEAGHVETPYHAASTGLITDGVTLGGAKDPRNRRQHQQETRSKRNQEAGSLQNHNTDKNSFERSLELGDFNSVNDASREVFNRNPYSHSSSCNNMRVGELDDNDFMDDEYIAGLLDLEGHDSNSGAQKFPPSTISNPFSIHGSTLNTTDLSSSSPCSPITHDEPTESISRTLPSPFGPESSVSLNQRSGRPGRGMDAPRDSGCHCLNLMLRLLDEVETKTMALSPATVDEILAYHRHAVETMNEVLRCRSCCSRSEFVTLLTVISEKLAIFSGKIVAVFICHLQGQDDLENQKVVEIFGEWRNGKSGMRLGEYEVKTHKEWTCLITAVITLQLRELMAHVRKVRLVAASTHRGVQVQGLKSLEGRLKDMLVKMQQVGLDSELDDG